MAPKTIDLASKKTAPHQSAVSKPATQPVTPSPEQPHHLSRPQSSSHKTTPSASTVTSSRIEKKPTARHPKKGATHKSPNTGKGLMRVFINNRLGTRQEIQCSPSDTIGEFKRKAAAQVGMRPEAMMLRRQGQRALKDALALEDYEIGGGVVVGSGDGYGRVTGSLQLLDVDDGGVLYGQSVSARSEFSFHYDIVGSKDSVGWEAETLWKLLNVLEQVTEALEMIGQLGTVGFDGINEARSKVAAVE